MAAEGSGGVRGEGWVERGRREIFRDEGGCRAKVWEGRLRERC